jgi:hypothetical protein
MGQKGRHGFSHIDPAAPKLSHLDRRLAQTCLRPHLQLLKVKCGG